MVDISRWTSALSEQKRLELSHERAFMATVPRKGARFNAVRRMATPDADILGQITQRAVANLARSTPAKEFLQQNGITDSALWAQYRLGVGDPLIVEEIEAGQLSAMGLLPRNGNSSLLPTGLLIPTFDPRQPNKPVGLVKINYGQNLHRFLTPPAGLICAPGIESATKIIIADLPFLGLRLAQAGAQNVVVAESPNVLPPLADWLAGREVVLVAYKPAALNALAAACSGVNHRRVLMPIDASKLNLESRALLGLPPEAFKRESDAVPELTQPMLVEILEFARQRLAAGEGLDVLASYGADHAEFLEVYGLGYLPRDFISALPRETARALDGRLPSNALVIPAYDEQNTLCDLYALKPFEQGSGPASLYGDPRGLVAPKVATAYRDMIVTDSFRLAAKTFRSGQRNVLLMRGPKDAILNAKRLKDAGIESATVISHRDGAEIASALRAAGIDVETEAFPRLLNEAASGQPRVPTVPVSVPATPQTPVASMDTVCNEAAAQKPELLGHDERMLRAKFKAGDVRYEIETTLDCGTRLEVRVELEGRVHLDRFDVSKAAQRRRFAESAALKAKVPCEDVEAHLIQMLDAVRGLQERMLNPEAKSARSTPAEVLSEAEMSRALLTLRDPNLLDTIAADLTSLGWTGEEKTKRLLYLIATSRKLKFQPPLCPLSSALLSSSSSGKTFAVDTVCALMPPEDVLQVSKLSDSALFYLDPGALRHRILVVPESDVLSKEIHVLLRVLLSGGGLTHSRFERDMTTGQARSRMTEIKGPVSLLTTSAGTFDGQVLSRCVEIRIDESPAQTQRIVAAQLRQRSDAGCGARREEIVRRHHALQRLLEPMAVLIPFADRIEFNASRVSHRRLLDKFLNLIAASALLHQYQRPKDHGVLIASERDFTLAAELMSDALNRTNDELGVHARAVVELLQAEHLSAFTLADLAAKRPDWTRHTLRTALDELLALEVLTSPQRGRPRCYELVPNTLDTLSAPAVRLLPVQGENRLATRAIG